ncbi:MAG TPA: hypothetical protein VEB22_12545 [Phycisphaerales bacterium]|nr:hypothetical protein [Phycisphaerales bacterium]
MHTSPATVVHPSAAWLTAYRAASRSAIFSALHLAAADIDALARHIADRCTQRRQQRPAGTPRRSTPARRAG